mgnify:FL=1
MRVELCNIPVYREGGTRYLLRLDTLVDIDIMMTN